MKQIGGGFLKINKQGWGLEGEGLGFQELFTLASRGRSFLTLRGQNPDSKNSKPGKFTDAGETKPLLVPKLEPDIIPPPMFPPPAYPCLLGVS